MDRTKAYVPQQDMVVRRFWNANSQTAWFWRIFKQVGVTPSNNINKGYNGTVGHLNQVWQQQEAV